MPDNTINWGQAVINNDIDWGKAKTNSTNNFGVVYDSSPSGDTDIVGSNNRYSMSFDGVDNYIDVGDDDVFSFGNGSTDNPFSVSVWVKFTTVGTVGIISKYGTTNSLREWVLYTTNGNIRLLLHDGSKNNYATGSTTLLQDVWYHIVATYDGRGGSTAYNGMYIYINGQSETLTGIGGTYVAMQNTTQPVEIGRYQNTRHFNGKIDEVGIWNTELSSTQVSEIYSATSTNLTKDLSNIEPDNLKLWYRMGDDDTFPTVTDNAGSNDGTMTNMSSSDIVNDTPS